MPILPPPLGLKMKKAVASSFSPTDIAGLQLWLDATTGLFDATSGGSAVTTDGSAVARWEDQSGNGRHATQATSNNRPVLKTSVKNGKNVLRFDGDNDGLQITSYALGSSPSYSVFIVIYQNGLQFAVWLEGGNLNPYLATTGNNKGFRHYDGSNVFDVTQTTENLWNLFSYRQSTTARNYFRNDGTINTGTASTRAATFEYIGRSNNGYYYKGDIAELIIYNSYLSDSSRELVRDYLNTKWSIY